MQSPPPAFQEWMSSQALALVPVAAKELMDKRSRACIICQVLATNPGEEQLHRLVRIYEAQIGDQANRLINLENTEKYALLRKVEEQAQTIDRLNLIIENSRRRA